MAYGFGKLWMFKPCQPSLQSEFTAAVSLVDGQCFLLARGSPFDYVAPSGWVTFLCSGAPAGSVPHHTSSYTLLPPSMPTSLHFLLFPGAIPMDRFRPNLVVRGTAAWTFVVTGVIGGFTTFSAVAVELNDLAEADRMTLAVVYGSVTLATGIAATALADAGRDRR